MVTSKQFPNVQFKVEPVRASEMLPFFSETVSGSAYCICNDGSVVFFFQMNDDVGNDDVGKIIEDVVNYLPCQATFQIYRLCLAGKVGYFGSVKVFLDYSFLKLSYFDVLKNFFRGSDAFIQRVNVVTLDIVSVIESLLKNRVTFLSPVRRFGGIYSFLMDGEIINGELLPKSEVGIDVSVVSVGKEKKCGMLSVNEFMDSNSSNVFKSFDCLQVFTVCAPLEEQEQYFNKKYVSIFRLLDVLASERQRDVDKSKESKTKVEYEYKKLCFYNSVIVFREKDLSLLIKVINEVRTALSNNGFLTYLHTNSARDQYVACFPGRAECGAYYLMDNCGRIVARAKGFLGL
jgi:hypothetical protein